MCYQHIMVKHYNLVLAEHKSYVHIIHLDIHSTRMLSCKLSVHCCFCSTRVSLYKGKWLYLVCCSILRVCTSISVGWSWPRSPHRGIAGGCSCTSGRRVTPASGARSAATSTTSAAASSSSAATTTTTSSCAPSVILLYTDVCYLTLDKSNINTC